MFKIMKCFLPPTYFLCVKWQTVLLNVAWSSLSPDVTAEFDCVDQNLLKNWRFFVLWRKKRMSKRFLGVILCAVSSVWGWVQRWELHWSHLVDEKWTTNKRTHKKSSRPLCRISNHPPFNTKSRYNIYIHGLKGKNRYACEEGWCHQSGPSTHFL